MLLARLFQTLDHPAASQEVPSYQAFRRPKHLIRQEVAGPVMAPRSQIDPLLSDGIKVHEPPFVGLARSKWPLSIALFHRFNRRMDRSMNGAE